MKRDTRMIVTGGLALLVLLVNTAHAQEPGRGYVIPFDELYRGYAHAVVDQHLMISCHRKMISTGSVVITNPSDCLKAADELNALFKGQYMEVEVQQQINQFLERYSLRVSL